MEGLTENRPADAFAGEQAPSRWRRVVGSLLPVTPVAGSCVVSLVALRAELTRVPYLNDSSVAEEMVRFALGKIRTGHFPPDSWFPFLNLGSPQFLHYQSLAAMLTALVAWPIGVDRAFTLETWLLIGCWPLCVYGAARVFGLGRAASVAAGVLSPFVSSATGVGFEQISYLWIGYGLWSQLFAMWTLPFAWAFSWRAVDEGRFLAPAAVAIAATAAFHFETGYVAFLAVPVFVVVRPGAFWVRLRRGLLAAGFAAMLDAWAIVPLVAQGKWAAVNQFLQTGAEAADSNSYGAARVLSWLLQGDLFDWHHLVLITPLVLLGLLDCLWHWRSPDTSSGDGQVGRALVVLFFCTLLLFFGRPTLGALVDLLPGVKDLFLRRFLVGVQLAGLFLAGTGTEALCRWIIAGARRVTRFYGRAVARHEPGVGYVLLGCLSLLVLVPAWSFVIDQADSNAVYVAQQAAAGPASRQLDGLLADIAKQGGGRTFAGSPSDWGAAFTVGDVPVYEYLASREIDEVGFTLRTASLMADPEVTFDQSNPADYAAFGIRFLILPFGSRPQLPARRVAEDGNYVLWSIPRSGYVQVVDTRGVIAADSADLATFSASFLSSLHHVDPVYPTVSYEGSPAAPATLPAGAEVATPAGRVLSARTDLVDGTATVRISATRTAVVLLSASYDPGWQATVDGTKVATEMVAPALVGVRVPPGLHTVRFVYHGFPDYPQLFAISVAALAALIVLERHLRAGLRRRH